MSYPIVEEAQARGWYEAWREACIEATPPQRVAVCSPESGVEDGREGAALAWQDTVEEVVANLSQLLSKQTEAVFESEGAAQIYASLPSDHPALRDERFWTWFACGPARSLILQRYAPPKNPYGKDGHVVSPLPGAQNFFGSGAKETLPFRLWIRAAMAVDPDPEAFDPYAAARPGKVDFWRSHVFRQLYAHHPPFLRAWIEFQFPNPDPDALPRLKTKKVRLLARELSQSCGTLCVEALDLAQCAALIQRVHDERVQGVET